MAYYSKTLENISNITLPDYRGRDKAYSECVSVAYATAVGPTTAVPSTSCVPGSSGSISLPNLAPIQSQELDPPHVILTPEEPTERDGEAGPFFGQREQDRKVRREIANSNERRRMQSINAGFKSLKTILPHADGDKLSKAAILQQTAEYIFQLESDKLKLLDQNEKLRRACAECSSPKHRAFLTDISEKDEGIGSPREEDMEDLRRDTIEVRQQLDKERRLRMVLEEKVRELEAQVYPEKLRELANNIAAQYKQQGGNAKQQAAKEEATPSHRPTQHQQTTSSDRSHCVPVLEASTYGKVAAPAPQAHHHHQPPATPYQQQQQQSHKTNPHVQKVVYPVGVAPAAPPTHLSPLLQADSVPPAALCVSVPGTPEAEMKSPASAPAKSHSAVPRSRQPLKKRAIDVSDIEPKPKVSKVASTGQTTADPMSPPVPPPTLGIVLPTASVITTNPAAQIPSNRQLSKKHSTPLYSLHPPLMPHSQTIQLTIPENVRLEPSPASPSPKYMTLSTVEGMQQYAMPVQQPATPAVSALNASAAISGVITSLRLAPGVETAKPEELTLNQLNSVPALSMTLTQLNAVPNVTRPKATMMPSAPQTRVQSQYLPLVAMDAVLGRHAERRISTATNDSTASDEDCRSDVAGESANVETRVLKPQTKSAAAEAPEPQPLRPAARTISSNSDSAPNDLASPASSIATATALSVLSSGPGSPPVIRHIDTAATRRNLETIVQAIDHLEQQERRNSQDNPACIEEEEMAPR